MNRSTEINELATALALAQLEMKAATKSGRNPQFKRADSPEGSKYASLPDVVEVAKALNKHGLAYVQAAHTEGDDCFVVAVETMLAHKSGQWVSDTLKGRAQQATPQGIGSAITYFRRFGLCALVGIVADEDDDGNAASAKPPIKSNGNGSKPYGPPAGPSPEEQEADRLEKVCAAGFDNELAKLQWKAAYRDIINGLPKDRKQSVVAAFEKAAVRQ